jgi:hypothetical protein
MGCYSSRKNSQGRVVHRIYAENLSKIFFASFEIGFRGVFSLQEVNILIINHTIVYHKAK